MQKKKKKHLNITGTMYVIIYHNAATKNSLLKRLLQFTKLEYMDAFATHNLLPKNRVKFDRKIPFSYPALAIIRSMTMTPDIFSGT